MRHRVATALAAIPCLLILSAAATGQTTPMRMERPRSITVAGTGSAVGEPDKARVQLTVQKSNPVMDKARADAVAVVEKFLALTKKLGIDPKKVRTTSALVNPEYRWEQQTNRQILTGYMVQRQLEVEVTDLDKLGALIEGAVDAGVNNVSPPMLDSSRSRDLNRQALAAAAKDAESNARAIAETPRGEDRRPSRTYRRRRHTASPAHARADDEGHDGGSSGRRRGNLHAGQPRVRSAGERNI